MMRCYACHNVKPSHTSVLTSSCVYTFQTHLSIADCFDTQNDILKPIFSTWADLSLVINVLFSQRAVRTLPREAIRPLGSNCFSSRVHTCTSILIATCDFSGPTS